MNNNPQAHFFLESKSDRFPFGLGSDNHSGVHPRILSAIERVNDGSAASYGTDLVTKEAIRIFRSHFGVATDVYFCFNGTAANVLALAPLVRSYNSIICSAVAHINVDECSAPEKLLGTKLIAIDTADGKLTPELIEPHLIRKADQHFAQPNTVSITQPTEYGTIYSLKEIAAIATFCKKNDLWLHIDGARFVNASSALGCDLREVAQHADVLSFGGTKNGLMFGEAVLFLSDKARHESENFPFLRKQLMQLPSKTRFIAAQFIEFLGTQLWREISDTSRSRALELRTGLEHIRDKSVAFSKAFVFTQKTESNAIFLIFDLGLEKAIKKSAFFYVWNEKTRECRLMTSWDTTPSDINMVLSVAQNHLTEMATRQ